MFQNVSHDVLAFILDYIYTGEAYVPKEKISLFITTAKALQITGIKDIITPMVFTCCIFVPKDLFNEE